MEDFRTSETGHQLSIAFAEQTETSNLGFELKEPLHKEWTDEKHRLYLKSMEASFVEELYNSDDILAWRPPLRKLYSHSSRKMYLNTRTSPGKKINFNKTELQLDKTNGSRLPSRNSCIQHFRSRQNGPSPSHQHYSRADREAMNLRGEERPCNGLSTVPKCLPVGCLHVYHQVGSHKEVSDQNFIGEDIGGEKLGTARSDEKMVETFADSSIDDQVVPFANPTVPDDLAENCVTSDGERHHDSY